MEQYLCGLFFLDSIVFFPVFVDPIAKISLNNEVPRQHIHTRRLYIWIKSIRSTHTHSHTDKNTDRWSRLMNVNAHFISRNKLVSLGTIFHSHFLKWIIHNFLSDYFFFKLDLNSLIIKNFRIYNWIKTLWIVKCKIVLGIEKEKEI